MANKHIKGKHDDQIYSDLNDILDVVVGTMKKLSYPYSEARDIHILADVSQAQYDLEQIVHLVNDNPYGRVG